MIGGMAVDVHPIPRSELPQKLGVNRLYSAADLEAMIELLKQEPVLLGDKPAPTERHARYRAAQLRRLLAIEGVQVSGRTWPLFTDGEVTWQWCVVLKEQANGR